MSVIDNLNLFLWNTLHVLGKTYIPSPENKQSFKCIFYCLADIIPIPEYRNNLYSFLNQYNIDNYLSCNNKAFEYTYLLHNYINVILKKKTIISLELANEKYQQIDKQFWGNNIWGLLHIISANLNDVLTESQKLNFKAFIVCISFLLPCSECRIHAKQYLSGNLLDKYLNTRYNTYLYIWEFHNNVNKRLNKPIVDFNSSYYYYTIPKYGVDLSKNFII